LPWFLASDADLVVHQDGDSKAPMSVADVFCSLATKQGIMNISTVDYNMRQKVTPEGDSMNFRYEITCKTKLNVFIPRAVADGPGSDPMKARASSFGAYWAGKYAQLPSSEHAKILWEASRF